MLETDEIVQDAVSRVYAAAEDDWVQLVELQACLLDAAERFGMPLWFEQGMVPAQSQMEDPWLEQRLSLGMRVVREVIDDGRLAPGDVAPTFVMWHGSPKEWMERIEQGWRAAGSSLGLGDVCWFGLVSKSST